MIKTFNNLYIPNDLCNKIKELYESKLETMSIISKREDKPARCQKVFHELDNESWIFNYISNFIKVNIGEDYNLLQRVTILKYDEGDLFSKHKDGDSNNPDYKFLPQHFYGGVELSERDEFEGGEFLINDNVVEFKKGRLFTHGYNTYHSVNKVRKGTRWSLHFLITSDVTFLI